MAIAGIWCLAARLSRSWSRQMQQGAATAGSTAPPAAEVLPVHAQPRRAELPQPRPERSVPSWCSPQRQLAAVPGRCECLSASAAARGEGVNLDAAVTVSVMSGTVSRGGEAGQQEAAVVAGKGRPGAAARSAPAGGRGGAGARRARSRGGDRVGGGCVPVAWLVRERAGGAAAGDAAGGAGGSVVGGAGGRDLGVRGVVHGAGAGRRRADLAAVGGAGDPAGAGALPGR